MKARMISFNILKEICIQKGYSNLVLQKKLEAQGFQVINYC